MKFKHRVDDLEVRSCDKNLCVKNAEHDRAEIVKWTADEFGDEYCYTLACFVPYKDENYDLKFIGSRPFVVESDKFIALAKIGYELLMKELYDKEN